ncbi:MAG: 50S ribosomal protein L10 [Pirellulales bacterium]|nr:50S ribosomal protein L10 [Pirellulales bacterium]
MSKLVKQMLSDELRRRLSGVEHALVVSVAGLDAQKTFKLRRELRAKNIRLMVVKNSVARRAVEGTPLAPAFEQMEGSLAVVWGGEDVVSLAKEVVRLAEDKQFAPFAARGGVMDGARLTAEQVKAVSKWPSRAEQLSLLVGQILGPGAQLAAQLLGPGGALASQIQQLAEKEQAAASGGEAAPAC